jgi:UDP-N-acetylmuramate dehydrogenase
VIGTRVRLAPGGAGAIRGAMDEAREWRRATQPLAEPNCGSVFTNPQGDHAARLIEAAGGKGRRVGGAWVSPKHANFIVAGPGARAADVVRLIEEVRSLVADTAGVVLEPEVRMVGSF